jgi:hypothetical protein
MFEPGSIIAIVISSITAIGSCLVALHIKRMKSGCFECETEQQKLMKKNSLKNNDSCTSI